MVELPPILDLPVIEPPAIVQEVRKRRGTRGIFAAGVHRTAWYRAEFGVHRPATDGVDTVSLRGQDLAYYTEMGPVAVNELAYTIPNWDLETFSGDRAITLGLVHEVTR